MSLVAGASATAHAFGDTGGLLFCARLASHDELDGRVGSESLNGAQRLRFVQHALDADRAALKNGVACNA